MKHTAKGDRECHKYANFAAHVFLECQGFSELRKFYSLFFDRFQAGAWKTQGVYCLRVYELDSLTV